MSGLKKNMNIAIQVSDLDHARIDGTRVYVKELLKRFGPLAPDEHFELYHKQIFNEALQPEIFPNYSVRELPFPFMWMQTRFAWEMFRTRPEKLFLPIQATPVFLPRSLEVIATIHDLAFKKYPETFPRQDLWKLNFLLARVVARADKLIAVSQSTKEDLLYFFPHLDEAKVRVIHHGFDAGFFGTELSSEAISETLMLYQLQPQSYCLFVGALQPRKNLVRLIEAFELAKQTHPEMKLVLAGEEAWLAEAIVAAQKHSPYAADIILTGRVTFETLRVLYQGARLFVFPSLYEGFGLPILEAFASGVPVLTAANSSLTEVAGDGALYCQAEDTSDMARQLARLWADDALRGELCAAGTRQLAQFSWEKCAEETLAWIKR